MKSLELDSKKLDILELRRLFDLEKLEQLQFEFKNEDHVKRIHKYILGCKMHLNEIKELKKLVQKIDSSLKEKFKKLTEKI